MSTGNAFDFHTQLRYTTEWFTAFSDLQKHDFLPILVENFKTMMSNQCNGFAPLSDEDSLYVDAAMPSIFQCRVKLFVEWSSKWNQEQKLQFIDAIRAIDSEFVDKFYTECDVHRPTAAAAAE